MATSSSRTGASLRAVRIALRCIMLRSSLLVLGLFLFGLPAQAQSTWNFDRTATEVSFIGQSFGAIVANGRFERYDGIFSIDFDHPEKSHVKVTLDAASISAGSALVDGFIAGANMLDSAKYPKVTFASDTVTRIGGNDLDIRGSLTIKGITHPFRVRVMIDRDVDKLRRGNALPFRASGSFLGPAYGIGRGVNIIDDQIHIEIKGRLAR
uniref:YceI family protein n=1 Tax=Bosea sp. NBC_00436 TaxID=2969620 RepID=A0A9E8CP58_9HYPH